MHLHRVAANGRPAAPHAPHGVLMNCSTQTQPALPLANKPQPSNPPTWLRVGLDMVGPPGSNAFPMTGGTGLGQGGCGGGLSWSRCNLGAGTFSWGRWPLGWQPTRRWSLFSRACHTGNNDKCCGGFCWGSAFPRPISLATAKSQTPLDSPSQRPPMAGQPPALQGEGIIKHVCSPGRLFPLPWQKARRAPPTHSPSCDRNSTNRGLCNNWPLTKWCNRCQAKLPKQSPAQSKPLAPFPPLDLSNQSVCLSGYQMQCKHHPACPPPSLWGFGGQKRDPRTTCLFSKWRLPAAIGARLPATGRWFGRQWPAASSCQLGLWKYPGWLISPGEPSESAFQVSPPKDLGP